MGRSQGAVVQVESALRSVFANSDNVNSDRQCRELSSKTAVALLAGHPARRNLDLCPEHLEV